MAALRSIAHALRGWPTPVGVAVNSSLKVFDAEGPAKRATEGFADRALGRGIDDTTMVHIVFEVTDMAKARAAIASDEKKKLMTSAGVIGKPDIRFYNAAQ